MRYHPPDEQVGKEQIKLIHVAKSKLKLGDEDYRALLWGAAKVVSSKDLTFRGYRAVMARFEELGFKAYSSPSPAAGEGGRGAGGVSSRMRPFVEPVPGRRAGAVEMASVAQQEKIYALFEDVARNKTPQALKAFLKKRFGVESMSWLTHETASKVIEALKKIQARARG